MSSDPPLLCLQLEALKLPLSATSLPSLPPFSKTNTTLANVHKTGLGSSAALITSLCSALLLHLHAVRPAAFDSTLSPADNNEMALVHNVAQYCHCLAQGKVGSGFDVSSAVWGSQVYRKFGPDALDDLMADDEVRLGSDHPYQENVADDLVCSLDSPRGPSCRRSSPRTRDGTTRSRRSTCPRTPDFSSPTSTPGRTRLRWSARSSSGGERAAMLVSPQRVGASSDRRLKTDVSTTFSLVLQPILVGRPFPGSTRTLRPDALPFRPSPRRIQRRTRMVCGGLLAPRSVHRHLLLLSVPLGPGR